MMDCSDTASWPEGKAPCRRDRGPRDGDGGGGEGPPALLWLRTDASSRKRDEERTFPTPLLADRGVRAKRLRGLPVVPAPTGIVLSW